MKKQKAMFFMEMSTFMPVLVCLVLGSYCLVRVRSCPPGFDESVKNVYLGTSRINRTDIVTGMKWNTSGVIPYKLHASGTALICCRSDGASDSAISFPSSKPFTLLKNGASCQQVQSMDTSEEWVSFVMWNSNPSYASRVRYIHQPSALLEDVAMANLHYCYYTPSVFVPSEESSASLGESASDFLSASQVLCITFVVIVVMVPALYAYFKYSDRKAVQREIRKEIARKEFWRKERGDRSLQRQHTSEANSLQLLGRLERIEDCEQEEQPSEQQRVSDLSNMVMEPSPVGSAVFDGRLRVNVPTIARNSITDTWSETSDFENSPVQLYERPTSRFVLPQINVDAFSPLYRGELSVDEQNCANDALNALPSYEHATNATIQSINPREPSSFLLPRNSGRDSPPSYREETSSVDLNYANALSSVPSNVHSANPSPSVMQSLDYARPPSSLEPESTVLDLPPAYDDVVN